VSLPFIDLSVAQRLRDDPDFRQRFFDAESAAFIARQLIELRERRNLSQEDLGEKVGTSQSGVSRVESADYRSWSYNTLRKYANALNGRIRVLIEPFEDIISEYDDEEARFVNVAPALPDQKDDQNAIFPEQHELRGMPDRRMDFAPIPYGERGPLWQEPKR